MNSKENFLNTINNGYAFKGESIIMGGAVLAGDCIPEHFVRIPLKTLNRHGLIAGATGTGKTKTLQILAEQLSAKGIPSLVMDVKGDLSGIAVAAEGHPKIDERHEKIGLPFIPHSSPVEFLSLSDEKGVRLRATVTEFGPVLFSKILGLNDTQAGIIAIIFKFCDDRNLPLLDLKDMKKVLHYVTDTGKKEFEGLYGRVSGVSAGTILRKIIELEQQGAELFFGERSFDVRDLTRVDDSGQGVISILRLIDIQDRPKLFSTFMLQLLAEIYEIFPEVGDSDKPKLVFFIDEAHLIFDEASDALLDQLEIIIKLIRSKGIGVYFITQNPTDIPDAILSQLGLKIQHALRAFTAKDRKAIKLTAENYPLTDFYDVSQILTELGIGEALLTALNEKGVPTPLVHTLLRAPQSRMDILNDREIDEILSKSNLIGKYNQEIDRESAYEILSAKIEDVYDSASRKEIKPGSKQDKSALEEFIDSTTGRQIGRTVARELTRGLLGVLGVKSTGTRKKSGWLSF